MVEPVISEFDLDNGLHVLLLPRHTVPLVAVNLWYHVGSKDEDPTRTGFAHLFEHMMFQGSKHVGKTEHFKYIQQIGGTLNASTNQDRTNYFETLPSSDLAMALWLESDRMASLAVTQENFENQLAVVKEERRQRYDNRPYGTVYEQVLKRVFPSGGYHWPTIGSMEHLESATLQEVDRFHKTFYAPNNASLAIVGDINEVEARELVHKYFDEIPTAAPVVRRTQVMEPILREVRASMEDEAPLPMLNIVWQSVPAFDSREYARDLLADILGAGRSSRLYVALVYEKRIAKEVSVTHLNSEGSGLFWIQATLQNGKTLTEAEDAIWETIHELTRNGITDAEFQKSRNRSEARHVRALATLSSQADAMQRARTFGEHPGFAFSVIDKTLAVSPSEIYAAASELFRKENSVCLTVLPHSGH